MAFLAASRLNHDPIAPMEEEDSADKLSPHKSRGSHYNHPSRRRDEQVDSLEAIGDWSPMQCHDWLVSLNRKEVAQEALKREVDGPTLIYMSDEGWVELGVESAIERSKLVASVKRLTLEVRADLIDPALFRDISRQNPYLNEGKERAIRVGKYFCGTWTPLKPWKMSRTPEGGAEHRLDWVLAIANSQQNPAEVKQHILRFLGMYNVIDLLVLTINFTYLVSVGVGGGTCETIIDAMLLTIMSLSALLASMGMTGSTILYNTCSAVSDANFIVFAKLPGTLMYCKAINDCSIHAGNCVAFSMFFWLYKICVENGDTPFRDKWQFVVAPIAIVVISFLSLMGPFFDIYVPTATHLAMFGGLFNSEPIAPLKEDPAWATKMSPTEIGEYVSSLAESAGQADDHYVVGQDVADSYARETVANIHGAGRDAQGADHLLSAALSTVIHPVITMAAAKKSSKVNKGRTMPLNPSSMT